MILDGRYHTVLTSVKHIVTVRNRVLTCKGVMKIEPIGIRFSEDERAALEKAAAKDDRKLSAMARKLVVDGLRRRGYLRQKEGARA